MNRAALAHNALVVLEEEIKRRVNDRAWYRRWRFPGWEDLEAENRIVLRALLRLHRQAREETRALDTLLAVGDHFAGMPR